LHYRDIHLRSKFSVFGELVKSCANQIALYACCDYDETCNADFSF
jgi:hypothetical protein